MNKAKSLNREMGEVSVRIQSLTKEVRCGFEGINEKLDKIDGIVQTHDAWIIRTAEWKKRVDDRHKESFDQGLIGFLVSLLKGMR